MVPVEGCPSVDPFAAADDRDPIAGLLLAGPLRLLARSRRRAVALGFETEVSGRTTRVLGLDLILPARDTLGRGGGTAVSLWVHARRFRVAVRDVLVSFPADGPEEIDTDGNLSALRDGELKIVRGGGRRSGLI